MRRDTVEQYLGKYVEVVLFDGDTLKVHINKLKVTNKDLWR